MGQIRIWARPGSAEEALAWDPWRARWVVSCRSPAESGAANAAIAAFLADRIGIAVTEVRWVHAGRSRAKQLEAAGLSDEELDRRLRRVVPSRDPE